eukprot:gene14751-biopygen8318
MWWLPLALTGGHRRLDPRLVARLHAAERLARPDRRAAEKAGGGYSRRGTWVQYTRCQQGRSPFGCRHTTAAGGGWRGSAEMWGKDDPKAHSAGANVLAVSGWRVSRGTPARDQWDSRRPAVLLAAPCAAAIDHVADRQRFVDELNAQPAPPHARLSPFRGASGRSASPLSRRQRTGPPPGGASGRSASSFRGACGQ